MDLKHLSANDVISELLAREVIERINEYGVDRSAPGRSRREMHSPQRERGHAPRRFNSPVQFEINEEPMEEEEEEPASRKRPHETVDDPCPIPPKKLKI